MATQQRFIEFFSADGSQTAFLPEGTSPQEAARILSRAGTFGGAQPQPPSDVDMGGDVGPPQLAPTPPSPDAEYRMAPSTVTARPKAILDLEAAGRAAAETGDTEQFVRKAQAISPWGRSGEAAAPAAPEEAETDAPTVAGAVLDEVLGLPKTLLHWAGRLTIRNAGRFIEGSTEFLSDIEQTGEQLTFAEDIHHANELVQNLQRLRSDVKDRLSPEMLAKIDGQIETYNAQKAFRREQMAGHRHRIMEAVQGFEDHMDNMAEAGAASKWGWLGNAVDDATDVMGGLAHLVFMDVLGLDGDSAAIKALPEADLLDALGNHVGALWNEGGHRGGEFTTGIMGVAMAIAGDIPKAARTVPASMYLFMHGPTKRAVARYKGTVGKYSAEYVVVRKQMIKRHGEKSPEFRAWERGEGKVPGALRRLHEKTAAAVAFAKELASTQTRLYLKEAKAQGLPGAAKEAAFTIKALFADPLQMADKRAAQLANDTVRGTRELEAGILGIARTVGVATEEGVVGARGKAKSIDQAYREGLKPDFPEQPRVPTAEPVPPPTPAVAAKAALGVELTSALHEMEGLWQRAFEKHGRPPQRKDPLWESHPLRIPYATAKHAERTLDRVGMEKGTDALLAINELSAVADTVSRLIDEAPTGIFSKAMTAGETALREFTVEREVAPPTPEVKTAPEPKAPPAEPLGEGQTASGAKAGVESSLEPPAAEGRPAPGPIAAAYARGAEGGAEGKAVSTRAPEPPSLPLGEPGFRGVHRSTVPAELEGLNEVYNREMGWDLSELTPLQLEALKDFRAVRAANIAKYPKAKVAPANERLPRADVGHYDTPQTPTGMAGGLGGVVTGTGWKYRKGDRNIFTKHNVGEFLDRWAKEKGVKPPPRPKAKLADPTPAPPKTPAEGFVRQQESVGESTLHRPPPKSIDQAYREGLAPDLPEAPRPRKRVHRNGIFEHEWDEFLTFVRATAGKGLDQIVKEEGPAGEAKMAVEFYERTKGEGWKAQSRPQAVIAARIHEFTPDEVAMWGSRVLDHLAMTKDISVKKAEYRAYRDVRRARGDVVTEDYRSLGLDVASLPDFEGAMDAGWSLVADGTHRTKASSAGPRPSGLAEGEAFAEFNALLNHRHPVVRSAEGAPPSSPRRVGVDPKDLAGVIETVERETGMQVSEVAVRGGAGVRQAPLTMTRREFQFSPEVEAKIDRGAEAMGLPAEWIKNEFAQVLETSNYTYHLKSKILRRRLRERLLAGIDHHNKTRANKPFSGFDGRRDVTTLLEQFDKRVDALATGYNIEGVLKRHGFTFNIRKEAKRALSEDPEWSGKAISDAVNSVGFTMADSIRPAKVRELGARAYAQAPETVGRVADAAVAGFSADGGGLPALLRASPEAALIRLERMERTGKLRDMAPNDIQAAKDALRRYKPLRQETMEQLGLDMEQGAVWAPKKFSYNMALERMQQDMITTNNLADRFVRTVKRGLVPLSIFTTMGNAMSDWNLLVRNTGNPAIILDVAMEGRRLHKYLTGKMKREDNVSLYEAYEALERSNLFDSTLIEAEFGHGAHKGILSILTDVLDGRWKYRVEDAGLAMEKYINAPLLKTFRATTNAFKVQKGMDAYRSVMRDAAEHRPGQTFKAEIYPNRWHEFVVVAGVRGFAGGRGFKHIETGRTLSPRQWRDVVARVAKVTSDKLFFDYSDAGMLTKLIRSVPGLRWTMGSLFHMYYIKSATIPGVKKGLLFDSMDPNPAFQPTNTAVKARYRSRRDATDARVFAMYAGAKSTMMNEDRDRVLDRIGFTRRESGFGALKFTDNPMALEFYDMSNMDVLDSTRAVARLITSGVMAGADAIGLFDTEDDELGVLYPRDGDGNIDYKLESIKDKDERTYIRALRSLKMRELQGKGGTLTDALMVFGLSGGPILDLIATIKNDDAADRVTDLKKAVLRYGHAMVGATVGRTANVAIAMVDTASPYSSFRFTLRDPDAFIAKPMSKRAKDMASWAIRTVLARTWKSVNLDEEAYKNKRYVDGAKAAMTQNLVKPLLDAEEAYRTQAAGAEGPEATKLTDQADKASKRAGELAQVIDLTIGQMEREWATSVRRLRHLSENRKRYLQIPKEPRPQ